MYHSTGTFSMQTILNQPINPSLCKRILQEIKSPLLQQSFAMTNDDSQSWINPPKRPNIPPLSYQQQHNQYHSQYSRRPNMKSRHNSNMKSGIENNKSWQLSQSFYDYNNDHYHQSYRNTPYEERSQFLQQGITNRFQTSISDFNKHTFEVNNKNDKSNRKAVESIVSPLDPSITQRRQDEWEGFDIWNKFCEALFNTNNQQEQHGRQCEKMRVKRKKIFDATGKSLLEKVKHKNNDQRFKQQNLLSRKVQSILLPNYKPSHIQIKVNSNNNQQHQVQQLKQLSLKEVLTLLRQSPSYQMAQFIQLICTIIQLLSKAQTDKKLLLQNIELVYQLTTSQQDTLKGLCITPEEQLNNFLERMNFTSLTDMIRKLSKYSILQKKNIDVKEYQREKNRVGESMERMLSQYEEVERLIQQYVNKKGSVERLKGVYKLVMGKFFVADRTKSTLQLLQLVLNDLKLYKYLQQAHNLEYIWDNFQQKVFTEQQFINSMVRIQGVYNSNQPSNRQTKVLLSNSNNISSRNRLQSQLQRMGYVKNY